MHVFFFYKQKTAYEMRISDWSSDVCSSDLGDEERIRREPRADIGRLERVAAERQDTADEREPTDRSQRSQEVHLICPRAPGPRRQAWPISSPAASVSGCCCAPACWRRSEEHTSELQSRMRISYAVFCLKKKK